MSTLMTIMAGGEEFENHLNEEVTDFYLDPYQPMMRKRARVWFSKPSGEGESNDLVSNESLMVSASQESSKSRNVKPVGGTSQIFISEPRTRRIVAAKRTDNKTKSSDLNLSDDGLNSSDDSESGEDDDLDTRNKKKRDNRPGAALRSNIACTELRQAFVANPHPAAHVLEALAVRLGLGKSKLPYYRYTFREMLTKCLNH